MDQQKDEPSKPIDIPYSDKNTSAHHHPSRHHARIGLSDKNNKFETFLEYVALHYGPEPAHGRSTSTSSASSTSSESESETGTSFSDDFDVFNHSGDALLKNSLSETDVNKNHLSGIDPKDPFDELDIKNHVDFTVNYLNNLRLAKEGQFGEIGRKTSISTLDLEENTRTHRNKKKSEKARATPKVKVLRGQKLEDWEKHYAYRGRNTIHFH